MLEEILNDCKYVVENAKYVKINREKIIEFAKSVESINNIHWLENSPYGILELPIDLLINFLLIHSSIEFSFWGEPKWTIDTNVGKEDGAFALIYSLLKYVRERMITDFSNMELDEFKEILKGNIEIPLLKERYEIVKKVSNVVNEKMDGNFYNYIKDIKSDNELFDVIVNNFPSFNDERIYDGKSIKFYKLAQLLTSDILHLRELKENIKVDYSNLKGCADYKIPQVMRGLGLLEYSEELSIIVDSKIIIEENSIYEVEIRASMIVVIDIIKEYLNNKICAIEINDYIWSKGRNKDLTIKPYHLTRTKSY